MAGQLVPFVGPSYVYRVLNYDAQRSINYYPAKSETGDSQTVDLLVGTPGLTLFANLGAGPIRGAWTVRGRTFMVSGEGFYEISLNGTVTNWGSVTFSNPLVCFSDNGTQVCVVGGNNGYVFTLATNTLVQITSSGWNGANTVAFLDGYGIFDWPGTNQYYVSALYDFTTINASNFSAIASSSNNIVAVHVLHQNVWVFGTNSVEIEYDAGNLGFPFARIQGAFIEYGCVAPLSVVSTANTLLWLGNDQQGQGVVWMAQGYQPVRVSTAAIEYALAQYVDLSTASAWTYQEDGHYFYCLNVSGYGTTLVYDISMKQWHERGFWDAQYGRFDQHLAICHTFNFGYHLVGDYRNGNVYRMSPLFYDDNGSVIVRERTAPHMINNLDYIYYTKFQIDMETGVGLDGNPPTADQTPPVMLQISNDGGHTWGLERWSDAGVIGKTKKRVRWTRLGRSRDRIWRVRTAFRCKNNLLGAIVIANPAQE